MNNSSKLNEFKTGCLLCGSEIIYLDKNELLTCVYCRKEYSASEKCVNNHYVCNNCHSSGAVDIIYEFCLSTELSNPIEIANTLMKHPAIKMHGNEHHFLVPAVLLAVYYNTTSDKVILKEKLDKAKKRAEYVLGGFCGSHGNCGAAVGAGIFMSIITGATPLSNKEWQLSNKLTGMCLLKIAENGGPRCCKRNIYLSIIETVKFLKTDFNLELPIDENIKCYFSEYNRECKQTECLFYKF